jgi:hypothetical protein
MRGSLFFLSFHLPPSPPSGHTILKTEHLLCSHDVFGVHNLGQVSADSRQELKFPVDA